VRFQVWYLSHVEGGLEFSENRGLHVVLSVVFLNVCSHSSFSSHSE
jgi:hypothetical protein